MIGKLIVIYPSGDHRIVDAEPDLLHQLQHLVGGCAKRTNADVVEPPRWIPVTERLPENGWWCLVWGSDWNIPIMAFCAGKKWTDAQFEHPKVTHWMPLPEPPKEGDT